MEHGREESGYILGKREQRTRLRVRGTCTRVNGEERNQLNTVVVEYLKIILEFKFQV